MQIHRFLTGNLLINDNNMIMGLCQYLGLNKPYLSKCRVIGSPIVYFSSIYVIIRMAYFLIKQNACYDIKIMCGFLTRVIMP